MLIFDVCACKYLIIYWALSKKVQYNKKNRPSGHLSAVGMFFPFLLVAGPHLNAVVLQGNESDEQHMLYIVLMKIHAPHGKAPFPGQIKRQIVILSFPGRKVQVARYF